MHAIMQTLIYAVALSATAAPAAAPAIPTRAPPVVGKIQLTCGEGTLCAVRTPQLKFQCAKHHGGERRDASYLWFDTATARGKTLLEVALTAVRGDLNVWLVAGPCTEDGAVNDLSSAEVRTMTIGWLPTPEHA